MAMTQVQIEVSDKHYQYLQQRARKQRASLDQVVSALIEADIAWQQTLADDPMRSLFGQIDDSFDVQNIDSVVYGLKLR
jgi:FtsZ-binding cell division protein ZapB